MREEGAIKEASLVDEVEEKLDFFASGMMGEERVKVTEEVRNMPGWICITPETDEGTGTFEGAIEGLAINLCFLAFLSSSVEIERDLPLAITSSVVV